MATCMDKACEMPAMPGRRHCEEDWLSRQPPMVKVEAAQRRRALIPVKVRKDRIPQKDWPAGRRWCSGCQTFVRLQDTSGSRCKACTTIANYMSRIKTEYGIDPLTYQHLFETQGGRCAICRNKPKAAHLSVDHDHTKPCANAEHDPKRGCHKCIRGLVCSRCNDELLGSLYHNVQIARNALAYLETPPFMGDWPYPADELLTWHEKYGGTDTPAPY